MSEQGASDPTVLPLAPAAAKRHAGVEVDALYNPQDLATNWAVWSIFKAGQILIAGFFVVAQPLWMPVTWLGLVWGSEVVYFGALKFSRASQATKERLAGIEQGAFYASFTALGSAVYFLYVPENLAMQGVLAVCLVTIGALSVMRFAGNNLRGSLGAALVIVPGSVRLLFEGQWIQVLMGVGGFMVVLALAMLGKKQEAALVEQATLRRSAEDAVDAVATVGLAKARFFAAVSHDLRQPVHAIGLYLAPLLQSQKEGRDKQAVEGIYQSWQALDDLLSQVLDLTRMDAGNLQVELTTVALAPLVRGLVVQHSATAEKKGIRMVAMVPPERYVLADLLMLKRVLSNLIDNAIKFSPEDARIVVAARPVGAHWCVQVRDAGPGIALAEQAKVFEEFVQLNNPERDRALGMGLGLAIAKRFVDMMNGKLSVRSAPGRGTCMSVLLPRARPQAHDHTSSGKFMLSQPQVLMPIEPLTVPDSLRFVLRSTGKALLLVEDDMLVAQAIVQLMKDLDVPVVHATSAMAAMPLAHRACLAACDVRLPGNTTGLELAVGLTHMRIGTLLMTGETSADVRQAAQHNGLILLVKPVKPQALLDALGLLAKGRT
jgi:two-component system, sensor histidine kinase